MCIINLLMFRLLSLRLLLSVIHHLDTNGKTTRLTDKRQESNVVHFSHKMWHLVAKFNDVRYNQLTKFRVFIGGSCIFTPPHKFLWSIALTPLTDTMDKQTNKRAFLFVRLCNMDFDTYWTLQLSASPGNTIARLYRSMRCAFPASSSTKKTCKLEVRGVSWHWSTTYMQTTPRARLMPYYFRHYNWA